MAKLLKVWGGYSFISGKQHRTIVGTYTKKRAMELLKDCGITCNYFNNHWAESSNINEVNLCSNDIETVFYAEREFTARDEYKKLNKGVK